MFDEFVERLAPGGVLIACADDDGAAALADRSEEQGIRVLRYGSAQDGAPVPGLAGTLLSWEQQGTNAVAHIALAGEPHPRVMRLAVPGRHMALNALAALLAAIEAGAPVDGVLDGLAGFDGVRRRFELVGTAQRRAGVRRLRPPPHEGPRRARSRCARWSDRARRPMRARAGRSWSSSPTCIRAQPTFAREFGEALRRRRRVFVLDVYGAREQPIAGVSGATVVDHVDKPGAPTCRTSPPSPSRWPTRCARAMSSSRWARATSRCSAPRSSRRLRRGPTGRRRNVNRDPTRHDRARGRRRGDGEPEAPSPPRPRPRPRTRTPTPAEEFEGPRTAGQA